jgi:hypothetical protein
MKSIRNINISTVENHLITKGLNAVINFELSLLVKNYDEVMYIELLNYLINYFIDSKSLIKSEQTIAYHSWLLKFVPVSPKCLNIYEVKPDGQGFSEGADYAIESIKGQTEECLKRGVKPLFPTFSQMIVVSKGVIDGQQLDAVRYSSPNHMTGWWLTTSLYDGNINSLETIHYYHVAFNRPDIIKWLALPNGFRFLSGDLNEVWFDKEVLS